ncbi:uncharacterized protein ACOB8E_006329 isoform 1-T1 [Sarcophilus harrisii]
MGQALCQSENMIWGTAFTDSPKFGPGVLAVPWGRAGRLGSAITKFVSDSSSRTSSSSSELSKVTWSIPVPMYVHLREVASSKVIGFLHMFQRQGARPAQKQIYSVSTWQSSQNKESSVEYWISPGFLKLFPSSS